MIEYSLKLYVSQNFSSDVLSSNSILDFMTTVPYIWVSLSFGITTNDYNNFFIVFTRMFDIWRLFTLSKFIAYIQDEDNQKLLSNMHVILSLVLWVTALMKAVDDLTDTDAFYDNSHKFHHEFFFIMTTVSIIGYSGPIPETGPRITVIFVIIWAIGVIPSRAGDIVNIISKRSKYADYKYKLITRVPHIVLIGNVSTKNAKNFFDEYFHPDHGNIIRHCVIVKATRPDKKMEYMLDSSKYISKVHYIEGNPHEKETFSRAKLDKATNVVIMCNNLTSDPSKEDANTILQTMVIKKYLKMHPNSAWMVRLQLLNPESIMHYELSLNKETKNDQIVWIENLKLSLLAKSWTTPGLISLISNLIKSCDEPPEQSKLPKGREWEWLSEYWEGKSYEIYRVQIPKETMEKKFNEISNYVFKNYKCILFALEIVEYEKDNGPIMLNPGTYSNKMLSKTKVKFKYYGYMIADNLEDAEKIFAKTSDPRKMGNAEKYLNLGVITSHEEFIERNYSDRIIGDFNPMYDSSDEEDDDIDEEDENELEVENLEGDWTHYCHLTQNPVKLEDIKFNTLRSSKLAKDHIIIWGIVENMRGFVIPLRANHIKNLSPIVIFNEEEPSQQLWSQLSRFPQIYFVRGSALRDNDLDRINLEDAKLVVILSPMINRRSQTEGGSLNSKPEVPESKTVDEHDDSVLKEDNKDEDAIKEK